MADHESGPVSAQQILEAVAQPSPAASTQWFERVMDRYGFPTVVACVLGYVLYRMMTGDLEAMQAAQQQTQTLLVQHVQVTQLDQTEIRYLLRSICLNTADTEAERAGCVLPGQAR